MANLSENSQTAINRNIREYELQGISEFKCKNIHDWIRENYGSANKCSNPDCKYNKPKRYEWALIHGKKYERNVENFIQLCPSCHRKYDYKPPHKHTLILRSINNCNRNKFGRLHPRSIPYTICDGKKQMQFDSLTECAKYLGIKKCSLCNIIKRGTHHKNYTICKTTKSD